MFVFDSLMNRSATFDFCDFNYKQVKKLADLYKAGFSEHKGKTQL